MVLGVLGEVEVEAEVEVERSHDGKNSRGQHRKSIPNVHGLT